jgi:uncharacterized membrane protein YhaH (DUF805 family)
MIIAFVLAFFSRLIGLPYLVYIYDLAILIPGIAVGVRRMHDVGKSGWFIIIPLYNLILACTASERGENEYGPNPFDEEAYGAQDYEKPYDINV